MLCLNDQRTCCKIMSVNITASTELLAYLHCVESDKVTEASCVSDNPNVDKEEDYQGRKLVAMIKFTQTICRHKIVKAGSSMPAAQTGRFRCSFQAHG